MSVPAGTWKEDIQQIIDDGIQVRNRNYVQSTELVRKRVSLCDISANDLISVFLMGFFAGHYCCSEYGASASRVRAPAKGRRTDVFICLVGIGRAGDAKCCIKGVQVGVPSSGAGGERIC